MAPVLGGIVIPAVTPFNADGSLGLDKIAANLATWGQSSVAGYMFLGSNGEFRSLSDAESLRVAEAAIAGKQDKYLILGIGRESTYLTLAFLERVAALPGGIDYVSVLTPAYFAASMTPAALSAHYLSIADASPIPVLLYVAPGFANQVTPPAALVAELAGHPNIAGIKDTSKNMMAEYLALAGGRDDFAVLAGSIGNLRECLEGGGRGGVVSAANYLPSLCAGIVTAYQAGQAELAWARLEQVRRLAKATAGRFSVAGVKACMNILGLNAGIPRLPVLPVAADEITAMAAILQEVG
ncbi:MAG: dihydrodipicolinate synthase family protein [Propionibacteriaceae bacterium]|jgi:4-hydroxy-2-oxoglutarate aldolase|nr:dihydrodipicolinate synthase family protein [Propionibacteriaceae bacterium]